METSRSPISAPAVACRSCDLLHRELDVPAQALARCTRCGSILQRGGRPSLSAPIALALAGLLLFLCANLLPVLSVTLLDETHETSLLTGALSLWKGGFPSVAALVLLAGVVLPLAHLVCVLYVLLPLAGGIVAPYARTVFRLNEHFLEWGMLEVYLLGLLIAAVKLRDMVEIRTGAGLFCFAGTVMTLIALLSVLHGDSIWRKLQAAEPLP